MPPSSGRAGPQPPPASPPVQPKRQRPSVKIAKSPRPRPLIFRLVCWPSADSSHHKERGRVRWVRGREWGGVLYNVIREIFSHIDRARKTSGDNVMGECYGEILWENVVGECCGRRLIEGWYGKMEYLKSCEGFSHEELFLCLMKRRWMITRRSILT